MDDHIDTACVSSPIPGIEGFVGESETDGAIAGENKAVRSDPTRIKLFFSCPLLQGQKVFFLSFIHSIHSLTFPPTHSNNHIHTSIHNSDVCYNTQESLHHTHTVKEQKEKET